MAECATIARPYAKALFDLAREKNQTESWFGELKILAEVVQSERVAEFINQPELEYKQKAEGLLSLLDKQPVDSEVRNFVYILAENKRLSLLPDIFIQYQDFTLESHNTTKVVVYSAYPMTEGLMGKLISDIESHFQSKFEAELVVDPELIGGVKVVIGDQVLDLSIQGRLNALYTTMMN